MLFSRHVNNFHLNSMVKKILVIRFRQIGDAILSAALCSSLKRSFPDAEVHIVLNSGIAPLFSPHPDIDKVIPFTPAENKNLFKYSRKIYDVLSEEKYDVIVDLRSTTRTLLFSFLSLFTGHKPYRVGGKKWYSTLLQNSNVVSPAGGSIIDRNQKYADALSHLAPIVKVDDFKIHVSDGELLAMKEKMIKGGVDFSAPVMLCGVTTKLLHKRWDMNYMRETLSRIMSRYPHLQLVFNYAPGVEEADARNLYEELGSPSAVKWGVEARSLRELAAMCANCNFYFGNEGGTRHLVQAVGVPSYAIFSPSASMQAWLPANSVPAYGIATRKILSYKSPDYQNIFDEVTPDVVCAELFPFLDTYCKHIVDN